MPARNSFPHRGDVYRVQPDATIGHEIKKSRPAVVISNDDMNELAATVLVMPITSGRYDYYHWVKIKPPEGGLRTPSSIVTEQVRAIDKKRLRRRLGQVSERTMLKIESALRDNFAI